MEYMTLLGAEDVRAAARTMSGAAEDMQRAANSIDNTVEMFMRRFDEFIGRLEIIHGKWMDQLNSRHKSPDAPG